MGLGDGGAHVAFILDAGFQTWMLTHWGRTLNKFAPEELIRRLTSDTANAAGLHDRGILRPGLKADVNVIDWDRLGAGKPYIAHDLPAGGKRLLQEVCGYEATIVSGQVTYREGRATGALPGKLVRGPQAAA
jgi:N-acyl-D-aspartate/D-glutamate deacylase